VAAPSSFTTIVGVQVRLIHTYECGFTMLTFAQYLKDMAAQEDEFVVPSDEVEMLVERLGWQVRSMGRWNADGTLTMSRRMVTEALQGIAKGTLADAAKELETLTEIMDTPSAKTIVERLVAARERQTRELMTEYQNTNDPQRIEELEHAIIREIFPQ
jgi:hypothetical protein